MKTLGYGQGYKYSHDEAIDQPDQEYLPEEIAGTVFYYPGNNSHEQKLTESLRKKWKEKYGY